MVLDTIYYYRLFQPFLRKISTQIALNQQKNHYDVLGVSQKATQADVKTAYYNLSKVYHPDKNKDSDTAAQKFRDITAAYEVLGNVKTRKLYDRGMSVSPITEFRDTSSRFHRSREVRSRPPPPSGRTTVYDFDEWSKAHYGATFARDMDFKRRQADLKQAKVRVESTGKIERVIIFMGVFFLFSSIIFGHTQDYDVVRTKKNNT